MWLTLNEADSELTNRAGSPVSLYFGSGGVVAFQKDIDGTTALWLSDGTIWYVIETPEQINEMLSANELKERV